MAQIEWTAYWESTPGTPLTSPANTPTIRIRRLDTDALEVTDVAMTEVGDGLFKFLQAPAVDGIAYAARADGDPTAAGQVPAGIRYQAGQGNNKTRDRERRSLLHERNISRKSFRH